MSENMSDSLENTFMVDQKLENLWKVNPKPVLKPRDVFKESQPSLPKIRKSMVLRALKPDEKCATTDTPKNAKHLVSSTPMPLHGLRNRFSTDISDIGDSEPGASNRIMTRSLTDKISINKLQEDDKETQTAAGKHIKEAKMRKKKTKPNDSSAKDSVITINSTDHESGCSPLVDAMHSNRVIETRNTSIKLANKSNSKLSTSNKVIKQPSIQQLNETKSKEHNSLKSTIRNDTVNSEKTSNIVTRNSDTQSDVFTKKSTEFNRTKIPNNNSASPLNMVDNETNTDTSKKKNSSQNDSSEVNTRRSSVKVRAGHNLCKEVLRKTHSKSKNLKTPQNNKKKKKEKSIKKKALNSSEDFTTNKTGLTGIKKIGVSDIHTCNKEIQTSLKERPNRSTLAQNIFKSVVYNNRTHEGDVSRQSSSECSSGSDYLNGFDSAANKPNMLFQSLEDDRKIWMNRVLSNFDDNDSDTEVDTAEHHGPWRMNTEFVNNQANRDSMKLNFLKVQSNSSSGPSRVRDASSSFLKSGNKKKRSIKHRKKSVYGKLRPLSKKINDSVNNNSFKTHSKQINIDSIIKKLHESAKKKSFVRKESLGAAGEISDIYSTPPRRSQGGSIEIPETPVVSQDTKKIPSNALNDINESPTKKRRMGSIIDDQGKKSTNASPKRGRPKKLSQNNASPVRTSPRRAKTNSTLNKPDSSPTTRGALTLSKLRNISTRRSLFVENSSGDKPFDINVNKTPRTRNSQKSARSIGNTLNGSPRIQHPLSDNDYINTEVPSFEERINVIRELTQQISPPPTPVKNSSQRLTGDDSDSEIDSPSKRKPHNISKRIQSPKSNPKNVDQTSDLGEFNLQIPDSPRKTKQHSSKKNSPFHKTTQDSPRSNIQVHDVVVVNGFGKRNLLTDENSIAATTSSAEPSHIQKKPPVVEKKKRTRTKKSDKVEEAVSSTTVSSTTVTTATTENDTVRKSTRNRRPTRDAYVLQTIIVIPPKRTSRAKKTQPKKTAASKPQRTSNAVKDTTKEPVNKSRRKKIAEPIEPPEVQNDDIDDLNAIPPPLPSDLEVHTSYDNHNEHVLSSPTKSVSPVKSMFSPDSGMFSHRDHTNARQSPLKRKSASLFKPPQGKIDKGYKRSSDKLNSLSKGITNSLEASRKRYTNTSTSSNNSLRSNLIPYSDIINVKFDDGTSSLKYINGPSLVKMREVRNELSAGEALSNVKDGGAMGYLTLEPNGHKTLQICKRYAMYYVTLSGVGEVLVHNKRSKLFKSYVFIVPSGFEYSIINTSCDEPLKLVFVKHKPSSDTRTEM